MAQAAGNAWRDALLWRGASPSVVPDLEAYLQRFPNDQQVQQRLAEARNPSRTPQDELGALRQQGFEALNANRTAAAQQAFEAVLARVPEDGDALGGLGLVRLRQGRNADARQLLARAIAADPQQGRQKWGRALEGASFTGEVNVARNQLSRGQVDQAEQTLQRIARGNTGERADAEVLLGDIALRRGDPAGAEQRYRAALSRRPDLPGALSGLYDALQAQGRIAEAEELAARRGSVFANAAAASRAEQLRNEAQRSTDPEAAAALLRGALAANPANPWVRLDLARILARQGRGAEGRALMDELASSRSDADSLYAAALFAQEEGRSAEAATLLERIPDRLRSADANRLLRATRVEREVALAVEPARFGRPEETRRRLLEIAARPDPTGAVPAAVVRAFNGIGDARGAAEAARVALAVNRGAPPAGRIALAGALLDAGQQAEATEVIRSVQADPRLSAEDRRQVAGLQTGLAIRASDEANEAGDQAAGYDRLLPALRANPQDPAANLALARLYQGARDPREAQRIAEAVLQREPRNLDARLAVADAAIAQRQWGRVESLLAEGRAIAPNDPRIAVLEARYARASGDLLRARAALERAAEQRRAQLGAAAQEEAASPPIAAGPGPVSQNPFRRVALAGGGTPLTPVSTGAPADTMLADINRELADVRSEAAPYVLGNLGTRVRSGTAGTDRLREFSGTAEGSAVLPGVGGRLTLRAQAVTIDSGQLGSNTAALRAFGTNPLSLPGPGVNILTTTADRFRSQDTTASGVALGLAYQRGWFSADIGTTPLGFRQENILGGVEISPPLGANARLRITGERRAMTDSLLSWAGSRDPSTGLIWGGVVRNTGRGQVEFTSGRTNFYVGGGYSTLEGQGVADNTRFEGGAGFATPLFRQPDAELTTGLDLVYLGYDKNLRFFTLGQGGYFSPQTYAAANIPIDYRGRAGNLAYRLGAQVGIAYFKEDRSPLFPNNPSMQAQAVAAAAADPTVSAYYAGQTQTGFVGGLRADAEYAVTPNFRIGGLLRYDKAADWNELRAMLYARYRFE
ncbi:BCSC C-terminal domain-containing protein [Roseomonas sp. OT10]|nr:BCSC C-terminal domain-containing protein [Roseomonas sp. OT10]